MGKIIAISNQKGGVGKSTTAVNLAAALGLKGKKVLVIDFDPQGNTTTSFGIEKRRIRNTVYEAVIGNCRMVEAIVATNFRGVSVVPATQTLSGAAVEFLDLDRRSLRLKMQILTVKDDFDYIFIDCPPTLDLITINALAACDSVIIPIQCEFLSLEGLVELTEAIKKVKNSFNPNIEIDGILFTMYVKRYNLTAQVVEEVKEHFPKMVYKTVIPRNISLSEAPSFGEPVMYYNAKCKGAKAYEELADEFLKRQKKRNKGTTKQ